MAREGRIGEGGMPPDPSRCTRLRCSTQPSLRTAKKSLATPVCRNKLFFFVLEIHSVNADLTAENLESNNKRPDHDPSQTLK